MPKRVLVLGGGVAGMSAAHELAERGFEVEVHESKAVAGGKARTIYVAGSGTDGRPDLPGEHGFRFFPSFYVHLPDTMSRIPSPAGGSVADRLVQARKYLLDDGPRRAFDFLVAFPRTLADWRELLRGLYEGSAIGIPDDELAFFASRLYVLITSCRERRLAEYERIDWWRFIGADGKSEAYQRYLAIGLTRSLVALKAQEASTRTVGDILIQLLLGIYSPRKQFDRVLDGPTSEAWLEPWLAYLRGRGVVYTPRSTLTALDLANGRISGATVVDASGAARTVTADHYILALPVEAVVPLVTPALARAEPRLGRLRALQVAWMNGLQLFLARDERLTSGHANFVTSPSALTAISQAQFFRRPVSAYGDGRANGCLSIDISDWDSPGAGGVPLRDLGSADEVMRDVRAQLLDALPPGPARALDEANLIAWALDSDITFPNPTRAANLEPLLINTEGSWADRPDATTTIPNLFLAADYVRTHTDLATMEAANEAARRAVNGILAATGSPAASCRLWPLHEPGIFAPLRALDYLRFRLGLPHLGLGRAETRRLTSPPAVPRPRRCHRVDELAGPGDGYQSMRNR